MQVRIETKERGAELVDVPSVSVARRLAVRKGLTLTKAVEVTELERALLVLLFRDEVSLVRDDPMAVRQALMALGVPTPKRHGAWEGPLPSEILRDRGML